MAAAPKKANDTKNAEGEAEKTKSSKKKLFLFIGLALLLMAISVGGTLTALTFMSPDKPGGEEGSVEKVEPLAPAIYYKMTPNFMINFNVNGRQRFLQAELTLMYRDPVIEPVLELHMPAIRNGLVMLFSSKNFDELQTPEGKDILKQEAFDIVQGILIKEQQALLPRPELKTEDEKQKFKKKSVKDKASDDLPGIEQVLFTNFVMQ